MYIFFSLVVARLSIGSRNMKLVLNTIQIDVVYISGVLSDRNYWKWNVWRFLFMFAIYWVNACYVFQEASGRYLDLHELYNDYLNSKFGERIEYTAYLDVFSQPHKIPQKLKFMRYSACISFVLLLYLLLFNLSILVEVPCDFWHDIFLWILEYRNMNWMVAKQQTHSLTLVGVRGPLL